MLGAIPQLNDMVLCSWRRYGYYLSDDSCRNAWDKIGDSATPRKLHARPHGRGQQAEIPLMSRLPVRYLGDDGFCAIDVKLEGGREDTSSDRAISAATDSVLLKCVERSGSGGRSPVACESEVSFS